MTQILGIAGTKQSGKSSTANFVSAYVLTQIARANPNEPLPKTFAQREDGKIIVPISYLEEGETKEEGGVLDFYRKDKEFVSFASEMIWPYVKIYSYATGLKEILINLFHVKREQLYGSDSQKNMPTQYRWDSFPKEIAGNRDGFISGREFMQTFGTEICRRIYDRVWIDLLFSQIKREEPDIAIIDDCRFLDEIQAVRDNGGLLLKLNRKENDTESHDSEKIVRESPDELYDLIIDNSSCTLQEKNQQILNFLYEKKWFTHHIDWTP